MMKRATWFVSGAVAGAAGSTYVRRRVRVTLRRTARRLAPAELARQAGDRARQRIGDLGEAIREGRRAMQAKAAELTVRRDRTETTESLLQQQPTAQVAAGGTRSHRAQVIALPPRRHAMGDHPVLRPLRHRRRH